MGVLGPIAAALSSVTWAIGTSTYSKVSREHSAFGVNFTRALIALPSFLLASLLSLGFAGTGQAFAQMDFFRVGWFAVSMFSSYAFGDILFLWSSQSLGVPGALAIASIYPIWTAFAGYLIHGEALGPWQSAGLMITIAGVITVILNEPRAPEGRKHSAATPTTRGFFTAIGCSLFWALNSYAIAEAGRGTSVFVGNAVRMMLALPLCAMTSAAFGVRGKLVIPWSHLKGSLWVFFLEAFGGSFFFVYGLSHSPLALAATLTSLAPVLAVPAAIALKIERFSLGRTLGVCLVVFGLCLLVGAG